MLNEENSRLLIERLEERVIKSNKSIGNKIEKKLETFR